MAKSTTFSAPFLRSSLPPDTKILRPRILLRVKTTEIKNQYGIYYITCTGGSSILEGDDFTVSYAPVSGIRSVRNIIAIASAEGVIIFVLDIYNAFQNTILPNPSKIVYLSLPHLYMEWFQIKWTKHPLASINKNDLCIHAIQSTQGTKPARNICYDLLKSISVKLNIIRSSYYHALFSWVYMNNK